MTQLIAACLSLLVSARHSNLLYRDEHCHKTNRMGVHDRLTGRTCAKNTRGNLQHNKENKNERTGFAL